MRSRFRSFLYYSAACALIIAVFLCFIFVPMWWLKEEASGLMGATEAEVINDLGAPNSIVTAEEVQKAPPNHRWWRESYIPAPTHPLTNRALLYYEGNIGVVIFVGPSGKVEHVAHFAT